MSLLAAFVGMLGKQWLSRYLRHTGGSMVERCGDRQRKFDGLEKWPFRLFIESLPIMLQIALLLLTSGLSRYVWSLDASVARVIISFTVLGFLFYIGIVVAGTSSYECPFQTPASIALRDIRDSETTQKLLASMSPLKVISFVCITLKKVREGLVSGPCRVYSIVQSRPSWKTSLSGILPGIHHTGRKVGHQVIILLLQLDRAIGNAKQRLVQVVRMFGRAALLPVVAKGIHGQPLVPRNGPGLQVRVWNLEAIRKQNRDSARCVCWILRNITDPEAVDSGTRLSGTIQWFDGDSDHNPPFDFIVSTFETCFDSTKQLYPGMKNRAYFSAQAILQINTSARAQSRERASKYPIPAISSSSFPYTDPDLHHIIRMLESNSDRPTLDFPKGRTDNNPHLLWMSNLFLDLARVGPNPILKSYRFYLSAAITDNQAIIANTLLMWYMILGGHVEEKTFWALDKSYAVVLLSFRSFSPLKIVDASDSLETILSHLSTRVMEVIADGNCFQHLDYLLVFLAAWEKRPAYLTRMVSQWHSAIGTAAGSLGLNERSVWRQFQLQLQLQLHLQLRADGPAFDKVWDYLSPIGEEGFSEVGPGCDPARNTTSYPTHGRPQGLIPGVPADFLLKTLEVGFGLTKPGIDQHKWMFETAISSNDDEVIADAVSAWLVGYNSKAPNSCVDYLTKRVGKNTPFSPRLRRQCIRAIERIRTREFEMVELRAVHLLNRLDAGMDDIVDKFGWAWVLKGVIRLPEGLKSLSPHYWFLLDKLVSTGDLAGFFTSDDVEVMRSLKETEDWEKLEVWMVIIWQTIPEPSQYRSTADWVKDAQEVTRKLLSQRPSALPRFDNLRKTRDAGPWAYKDILQEICDQAKANKLSP
jgi:hypothetical protein